jgi:hypothetical protein
MPKNLCQGRWNVGVAAADLYAGRPEHCEEMPTSRSDARGNSL